MWFLCSLSNTQGQFDAMITIPALKRSTVLFGPFAPVNVKTKHNIYTRTACFQHKLPAERGNIHFGAPLDENELFQIVVENFAREKSERAPEGEQLVSDANRLWPRLHSFVLAPELAALFNVEVVSRAVNFRVDEQAVALQPKIGSWR